MLHHGLKRRDVARLLGKTLNAGGGYSNSTVDSWLSGKNRMPEPMLELLELKIAGSADQSEAWQRLIQQPLPYTDQREMERDLARVLNQIGWQKGSRLVSCTSPSRARHYAISMVDPKTFCPLRFRPDCGVAKGVTH
ncbi:MAG: hypothetical protein FKY71_17410 [Spiribacter salinus]|uniref:Uncharacterized protein n=1 Tax=Spiribacter salinus TaxID=1335746 RepID=A0A540VFN3_9GAMM|nr:MAG: hypothetical protein FKY71_17410 [Spiribacter salinus]